MVGESRTVVKNVGGVNVLYVIATDAEYGSELQKRLLPFKCQVGPVEAAVHLGSYLASHSPIDLVVSLGSAGSAVLKQAEIYQVRNVSYRDMDASPLGFASGETPFANLPVEIPVNYQLPGLESASLSTGANIVSGEVYKSIEAEMVDMETWALVRACMVHEKPFVGFRGISDGAHPVAELSDWTQYLAVIDQKLARVVDQLEQHLQLQGIDGLKTK